jgi:hypothetical protein
VVLPPYRTRRQGVAFTYRNRKGKSYYLHARKTKGGRVRYVFARAIGDGALDEIPPGYEVRETINGQVALGKVRPRLVSESEERSVQSELERLSLDLYRIDVKDNAIVVYEPVDGLDSATAWSLLGSRLPSAAAGRGRYQPVLRFVLVDVETRTFRLERMTYRGEGGWSWPLGHGKIGALARKALPHLGQESFFELL